MIKKETLLQTASQLPEVFSIDELIDRLMTIQKIEEARAQSNAGLGHSTEEARNMIKQWSK
jgi:hypothetical protein